MTLYAYKQKTWTKLPGEFRGVRPMTEKRFLMLGGRIKTDNKERTTEMDMTVHDVNGNEVHISKDEAERIAADLAKMGGKETNAAFMKRAQDNIQAMTGMRPTTEDEAKAILYKFMPGWGIKHVELMFETMEYIAAMHKNKVG